MSKVAAALNIGNLKQFANRQTCRHLQARQGLS